MKLLKVPFRIGYRALVFKAYKYCYISKSGEAVPLIIMYLLSKMRTNALIRAIARIIYINKKDLARYFFWTLQRFFTDPSVAVDFFGRIL